MISKAYVNKIDEFTNMESNQLCELCRKFKNENKMLKEQLDYALETLGQVAMLSHDVVNAVQCAIAICTIKDWKKEVKNGK